MGAKTQPPARDIRCVCGAKLAVVLPDGTLHVRQKLEWWMNPPWHGWARCPSCLRIRSWQVGK
jgi:hypothetical protein